MQKIIFVGEITFMIQIKLVAWTNSNVSIQLRHVLFFLLFSILNHVCKKLDKFHILLLSPFFRIHYNNNKLK